MAGIDHTRTDAHAPRRPRLAFALLVCGLALALAGCDWTAFGFDTGNSRFNNGDQVITVANVGNVKPAFAGVTGGPVYSSPAVSNKVIYVASTDGFLYAFDEGGVTGCIPSLKLCNPLWKANLGNIAPGDPTVANGFVYVTTPGGLYAFSAAGTTGCQGAPKTCSPLWQASFGSGGTSDPVVVNNVVYLVKAGALNAFDAAGAAAGCTGTPKICKPLWTATARGGNVYTTPAVVNGVAYVGSGNGGGVFAFDATGSTGCSGTPKTCPSLWSTSKGGLEATVVGGRLYSEDQSGLYAFDATGAAPCTGLPKVCGPLWTYSFGGSFSGVPAVANGILYVGHSSGSQSLLAAFDATGATCGGTPKVCGPLWQSSTRAWLGNPSSPSVANGVVFIGSRDGSVYAFDGSGGASHCTGTVKLCTPLWSSPTNAQVNSSPAIANGAVLVGSDNKSVYVFK